MHKLVSVVLLFLLSILLYGGFTGLWDQLWFGILQGVEALKKYDNDCGKEVQKGGKTGHIGIRPLLYDVLLWDFLRNSRHFRTELGRSTFYDR